MIELVYYSEANINLTSEDLSGILKTARDFNSKNNISGCLLYHNNEFLQILEGEKEIVLELFALIKTDKRHSNIVLISTDSINEKMFSDWSMAYHEFNPNKQEEKLFRDNVVAFSDIASKPTQANELFWTMAKHIAIN
ncbi:MAG: hypothetical protein ACJASQ_001280 [Crocinitomicaceae bacterium]|jgi:hypothetical protein